MQESYPNRFVEYVKTELRKIDPSWTDERRRDFLRKIKISSSFDPEVGNAWLKMEDFQLYLMLPKDELHRFLLGLFGEHILPAVIYAYVAALTRPDLVKRTRQGTSPFFSPTHISAVWKRLTTRFQSMKSSQSMITITESFTSTFSELYINKAAGIRMTGDRVRMVQLVAPFLFRDLIENEVSLYFGQHLSSGFQS